MKLSQGATSRLEPFPELGCGLVHFQPWILRALMAATAAGPTATNSQPFWTAPLLACSLNLQEQEMFALVSNRMFLFFAKTNRRKSGGNLQIARDIHWKSLATGQYNLILQSKYSLTVFWGVFWSWLHARCKRKISESFMQMWRKRFFCVFFKRKINIFSVVTYRRVLGMENATDVSGRCLCLRISVLLDALFSVNGGTSSKRAGSN